MEYQIIIVGIGPGDPDYVLPVALRTIQSARVLVGSQRALDTFGVAGAQTRVIDKDIAGVLDFMQAQLFQGDVVVMVSGDPGFYSLLAAVRNRFAPERIRVIPGISSVQLAFARLAEPWQDAMLISMHGRQADDEVLQYQPRKKLGILTDSSHNPCYIAGRLVAAGWPPETEAWLCASLSYDQERVLHTTLANVIRTDGFEHCVMVVKA